MRRPTTLGEGGCRRSLSGAVLVCFAALVLAALCATAQHADAGGKAQADAGAEVAAAAAAAGQKPEQAAAEEVAAAGGGNVHADDAPQAVEERGKQNNDEQGKQQQQQQQQQEQSDGGDGGGGGSDNGNAGLVPGKNIPEPERRTKPAKSRSPDARKAVHHEQLKKAQLTEQQLRIQRAREEHERFHKLHAGHEAMHAEMLLILMVTLVLAQIGLFLWRKYYPKSYRSVSLVGMWLIPLAFSIRHLFLRMLVLWTAFTSATAFVTFRATRSPLPPGTPRMVYKYFMGIYKLSYGTTFLGYGLAVLDFLGLSELFLGPDSEHNLFNAGLLMMFYGLYFGVLSRDFADICAGRMASVIGYHSTTGLPAKQLTGNICGLCAGDLKKDDTVEKTHRLPCEHTFHEFCLRGWLIVGKKQTCPFCREKVDLRRMFPSPWARKDVLYSQLLDVLRYLVVWQPIIITVVHGINWALGLK